MLKIFQLFKKFNSASIALRKSVLIGFIFFTILSLIHFFGGRDFLYNNIIFPLQFQVRNRMKLYTPLDARIKIFAVDQKTMNAVDFESLPLKDWTAILKAVAQSNPKAVFIDKVFMQKLTNNQKEVEAFKKAASSIKHLTVGAVVRETASGLTEIETNSNLIANSLWLDESSEHIYGPRPEIIQSFSHIGHQKYEDYGYIKPLIRTSSGRVIPHWGLYAGSIEIKDKKIFIDETSIPLDDRDRLLINLASPESYWKRTHSLLGVLSKARAGEKLESISSDDIVIILGGFYTGSIKFRDTPAGPLDGGFIMTEVINSVLQKSWFKYVQHEILFLALFCFLGIMSANFLNSQKFWLALICGEVVLVCCGLISFIFFQTLLPWGFPALGFLLTGITLFAEKSRLTELKSRTLQVSLEGMIDQEKLKMILSQPEIFKFEPKNQTLTVMFIDIVGFSTLAEQESPADVFQLLRELLGFITSIVLKHDGIIDRSLGDGLLCTFGYQFETESTEQTNHAEKAMICAQVIQTEILKRDWISLEAGRVIFPLRIGVNTGEVYVGDLGGGGKIDFTVIGHAVNFAQRLESACENYRVLCGTNTSDQLINESEIKKSLVQKQIAIKHHKELIEVFEFDPFLKDKQSQQMRQVLSRKIDIGTRYAVRWTVDPKLKIKIKGEFGDAEIVNFSQTGLQVKSNVFIGKGARIKFKVMSPHNFLEERLLQEGLIEMTGEVRWSWNDDGSYRLGLKFENFTDEMQVAFNSVMQEYKAS